MGPSMKLENKSRRTRTFEAGATLFASSNLYSGLEPRGDHRLCWNRTSLPTVSLVLAPVTGIEPTQRGLEALVLPLHYTGIVHAFC